MFWAVFGCAWPAEVSDRVLKLRELTVKTISGNFYLMKTLTTYEFLRHFPSHSKELCAVKKRGKVVGTWTPTPNKIEPVDILGRQKEDGFSRPLPFTGAELLKAGKKR